MLAGGLLALALPVGWLILAAVLVVAFALADPDAYAGSDWGGVDVLGLAACVAVVVVAVTAFARWARSGAAPDGTRLLVRGAVRSRVVAWDDVLWVATRPSCAFDATKVSFRHRGRVRTRRVALRHGAGEQDALTIRGWAPQGHPLRDPSVRPGSRVGPSRPAAAYVAFFWLITPPGWVTVIAAVAAGWFLAMPGTLVPAGGPWVARAVLFLLTAAFVAVLLAVPVLLVWWPYRRWVGRCATPAAGGLLVRNWFRTYHVPWANLLEVDGTVLQSLGKSFNFSHTRITFDDGDGQERTAVVSFSFRSGAQGAFQVLGWLPAEHPLRESLPSTVAERVHPVAPAERRRLAQLPVLDRLRPTVPMRIVWVLAMALLGAVPGALALGVVQEIRNAESPAGWVVVAAFLGGCLAGLARVALGFCRVRVQLTTDGLIHRGVLRTRAYAAASIGGFTVVPAGAGQSVHLALRDGTTRDLLVGASFGNHAVRTCERLEAWRVAHCPGAATVDVAGS